MNIDGMLDCLVFVGLQEASAARLQPKVSSDSQSRALTMLLQSSNFTDNYNNHFDLISESMYWLKVLGLTLLTYFQIDLNLILPERCSDSLLAAATQEML